jgi:hypothetical protein
MCWLLPTFVTWQWNSGLKIHAKNTTVIHSVSLESVDRASLIDKMFLCMHFVKHAVAYHVALNQSRPQAQVPTGSAPARRRAVTTGVCSKKCAFEALGRLVGASPEY